MVSGRFDAYLSMGHNYKEHNLIISDEGESNKPKSKSWIKFSIHPDSEHRKAWIRSSLDDPEKEYEVLHKVYEPINANSFEIEMNRFMFLSSISTSSSSFSGMITRRISDALLSRMPLVSKRKRYFMAKKIVSYARTIIAEKAKTISSSSSNILPDIQIEILVEITGVTTIFLKNEEAAEMEEYKRCHRDTIPASITAVAALERRRFGDDSNDHANPNTTCPICLEEYQIQHHHQEDEEEEEGSFLTIIRLPCCHEFHANCITKWLQKSHDCPICRFELPICLYEDML